MWSFKIKLKSFCSIIRVVFILPGVKWHNNKLMMDIDRWKDILSLQGGRVTVLAQLMRNRPEFRNLFIYRCGGTFYSRWVKLFYPPMKNAVS